MTTRRAIPDHPMLGATIVALAGRFAMSGTAVAAGGEEVTADEDLMREHGVLRRALLVHQLSAKRRSDPAASARRFESHRWIVARFRRKLSRACVREAVDLSEDKENQRASSSDGRRAFGP